MVIVYFHLFYAAIFYLTFFNLWYLFFTHIISSILIYYLQFSNWSILYSIYLLLITSSVIFKWLDCEKVKNEFEFHLHSRSKWNYWKKLNI